MNATLPAPTAAHHPARRNDSLDRLVKLPEACTITAKGRTSFLEAVSAGDIPPPLRIGKRAVAWRLSELNAWIDSRPCVASEQASTEQADAA